jgi:hypothetical protein
MLEYLSLSHSAHLTDPTFIYCRLINAVVCFKIKPNCAETTEVPIPYTGHASAVNMAVLALSPGKESQATAELKQFRRILKPPLDRAFGRTNNQTTALSRPLTVAHC